ncbi:class I SAM-dependent methyltransferase [Streptomyces kronopolitis]|uniref:class I SAM-dependent methyltransferase n=1 Tax=Streptomyces kronopolitis TaxID=1612435 RepID=UPI00343561A3
MVAPGAKATGFDESADMVRHARSRLGAGVDVRQHDLDDPLGDEAVDLVLAALVIHYVRDRVAALRELHQVLQPAGRLVLSISHPTADWLTDGGSYFDARQVEKTWTGGMLHRYWRQPLERWVAEITEAGFVIERLMEH